MSSTLIDFLRADKDGIDEDVGDGGLEDLEDTEGIPGEKLRYDIFNDNYLPIEYNPSVDEPPQVVLTKDASWVFPPLYKKSAQEGHTLRYQMGYNSVSKKLLWTVGRVETGGQTLFTLDIIPTRAQKGNFEKKAYQEARMRYDGKIRNGFYFEITGKSSLPIPLPMLANKYEPPNEKNEGNVLHFPVIAQPKLNGVRLMATLSDKSDEGVMLLTRHMKERKYFNHLRLECARLLEFLPRRTILDGELHSDRIPFQLIAGIAGTGREHHPREKELDYYLFDIYHPDTVWRAGIAKEIVEAHVGEGDDGYVYARASGYTVEDYSREAREYYELPHDEQGSEALTCVTLGELLDGSPLWVVEVRQALISNAFRCFRIKYGHYPHHIKLVKSYVIHRREDIPRLFEQMRAIKLPGKKQQLEGIMLRHMSRGDANPMKSLYRPGRSDNLLKVKDMKSTEVVITGVRSGKGKAKDLAMLVYREPDTGIVGTLVPAASHPERRAMLLNPDSVIGRTMTVTFQDRMASGAMQFPVGQAFVD